MFAIIKPALGVPSTFNPLVNLRILNLPVPYYKDIVENLQNYNPNLSRLTNKVYCVIAKQLKIPKLNVLAIKIRKLPLM